MLTVVFQEYLVAALKNVKASVASLGILNAAKVDLCKDDVALTQATVLTDLNGAHLANFTGYAQGVVTWGDPTIGSDGSVEIIGSIPEWRPTDSVTPNVVREVFVTAAVGGALLLAAKFDSPGINMNGVLNNILIALRMGANGQISVVIIE